MCRHRCDGPERGAASIARREHPSGCHARRGWLTSGSTSSSSAAGRPGACSPTACRPIRRPRSWCSRPAGPTGGSTRSSTCRRRSRSRSAAASTTGGTSPSPSRSWTVAASTTPAGKVLGGSSSINGMIFQRGNPLDYERWAAEPGMATWDYAHCLPYFKRMEDCAGGGAGRPVARRTAARSCWSADRPAARCSRRSSRPSSEAGYSLTDDVNGYRQEGFAAFDRNIHRGRRLSAARAYLHPALGRRNLRCGRRRSSRGSLFDGRRATGVEYRGRAAAPAGRGRRGHPVRRRDQHAAAAAAVGRRRRGRAAAPGDRGRRRPAGRRREPAGPPRGLHPARLARAGVDAAARDRRNGAGRGSASSGCSSVAGRARRITSRPAGSSRATRTSPIRT